MIVAELPAGELPRRLAGPGLRVRTGPVLTEIRSRHPAIPQGIELLYAEHEIEEAPGFADFHVRLVPPPGLRRWVAPQMLFQFDGFPPFLPLPAAQAFPMMEWGLNWCVSANCHQYLIIHAAVVERGGRALVLPAPPAAGKSTLCAGLVSRGWRLLSDELTLIEPSTRRIVPIPRPVSLKNASIEVIRGFAPEAVLGPTVRDTLKGAVAHMKPPAESVRRAAETAVPRWIVQPRYEAGASTRLAPMARGPAFMHLADSAFNYSLHGRRGFELLADVVQACECYHFTYSRLDEALALFAKLAADA